MNINLETSLTGVIVSSKNNANMSDMVNTVIEAALEYTRLRTSKNHKPQDLNILFQQQHFFCAFKYNLANGVAQVIGLNDENVLEIYLFEPCINPDSESGEDLPIDGNINLILLVSSVTAGLEAFIASLDRVLTKKLKELPIATMAAYPSVLNSILVTKMNFEQRKGYAALINSIHTPPLKIWQRL